MDLQENAADSHSTQNLEENVEVIHEQHSAEPSEHEKIDKKSIQNREIRKCPCPVCGKSFPNNWIMRLHFTTHTTERPYVCKLCGKSFKRKCEKNEHQQNHSNAKQFECDACGRKYRRKIALTMHKRVHTGFKPFKCSLCPMEFTIPGYLKLHARTHTDETPYHCHVCSCSFKYRGALKKHSIKHEQGKGTGNKGPAKTKTYKKKDVITFSIFKQTSQVMRRNEKCHNEDRETFNLESIVKVEDCPLV